MKKLLKRFMKDEQGLEMSEYAVMLALIVLALFVAVGGLKDAIIAAFERADAEITANTPAAAG